MAHVSLYRKYRPQTFDEVVGQDHVTTTLANALTEGRLHHAYLFTGPRGTGKTSTARILAKAVNCEKGPTPTPCNACDQCHAITVGSSVDVIEIDAASHGGVDDVRDLRERVAFAPASARMKVYIVDECHMLSTAGWNAFLKTVEEPPGHVLFVFATTEPHKVLDTILSRTQRFDFKRVGAETLGAHLRHVAAAEGMQLADGAVDLVVAAGDGSVRDTLSTLDQVVAFTGPSVSAAAVADVLGAVPADLLAQAADLVSAGDAAGVCALVGRLADGGLDVRQFARDAVEHFRRLLLVQVAPDADLVEGTPEQIAALTAQAARLGRVELLRTVELLAEAQGQMRRGNTRLPLEIALVKAAMPEASGDPTALAARLDRLERRVGAGGAAPSPVGDEAAPAQPAPAAAQPAPAAAPVAEQPVAEQSAPASAQSVAEQPVAEQSVAEQPVAEQLVAEQPAPQPAPASSPVDFARLHEGWPTIMEAVKRHSIRFHALAAMGSPTSFEDGLLTLTFKPGYGLHAEQCASEQGRQVIAAAVQEVLGTGVRLRCVVADGDQAPPPVDDGEGSSASDEADEVAEAEAAEAAGDVPDDTEAHDRALETLTRDLGATVIDDQGA